MDGSDVELESENSLTSSSPRPARKNIKLKLKSEKSSGRGRPRKGNSSKSEELDNVPDVELESDDVLEAPIFKTMEPGEPIHKNRKLKWDHKVNLLGEKVVDPLIHCCEICSLPILIYGRMIQCKHVFCFTCAKKTEKTCPRCGDPVQRIEQSALGTVFLCTYGGSKHGSNGCRRTYLSQRDLNAHIGHRHLKSEMKDHGSVSQKTSVSAAAATQLKTSVQAAGSAAVQAHQALIEQFVRQASAASAAVLPESVYQPAQIPGMSLSMPVSTSYQVGHTQQAYSHGTVMQTMPAMSMSQPVLAPSQVVSTAPQENYPSAIPVVGSRIKTLISVPIQEDDYSKKHQPQSYAPTPASAMPNLNYPPPSFPVGSMAPNIHQPPPNIPPPMFSSQGLQPGLTSTFTSPPPQMMSGVPPRVPPRMTAPPQGGHPRYFDNQGPRGPWTGAPRGPSGPPHPRGPPRADYNYY